MTIECVLTAQAAGRFENHLQVYYYDEGWHEVVLKVSGEAKAKE